MAEQLVTFEVRFSWWLWPYLNTLLFVCMVMGTEPDIEKLERIICRAMTLRGVCHG